MDECCSSKCWAMKLLVVGLVFILNQYLFKFDIWVVIGVIMIIKAIMMFIMPTCMCQTKSGKKK